MCENLVRQFSTSGLLGIGLCMALLSNPTLGQDDEKTCRGYTPGGSASCYLTGTYELRDGSQTWLHIINPTGHYLVVAVAFFDDDEKPLMCFQSKMSPNDLWAIPVHEFKPNPARGFGVAKVISFMDPPVPGVGIVGNQRILFARTRTISETGLHPIQGAILQEDLDKILIPAFNGFKNCKALKQ